MIYCIYAHTHTHCLFIFDRELKVKWSKETYFIYFDDKLEY